MRTKLPTSLEIYHRLRWDPRFQGQRFILGYEAIHKEPQADHDLPLSDHYPLQAVLGVGVLPKPVHRSALALVPPDSLWQPIQDIRKSHDRSFQRWMPHINLLYGFVKEDQFPEAAERVSQVLSTLAPFQLCLKGLGLFTHSRSHTLWLDPVSEPPEALCQLQAALLAAFPSCTEQNREGHFRPHLTLGQFSKETEATRSRLRFQAALPPLRFPVTEVVFLSRREDDPFCVRCRIALRTGEIHWESQEDAVLGRLRAACARVLGAAPELHLLGSHRLGVPDPESDLDVLCLGPESLGREDFHDRLCSELAKGGVPVVSRRVDGLVPLLSLELDGVFVDLTYATVPEAFLGQPIVTLLSEPGLLSNLPEESQRMLLGVADAEALLQVVGARKASFRDLLRTLRTWARQSGLYSNSYGYLGGFCWSVLAAWICANPKPEPLHGFPAASENDRLLLQLFQRLAHWDWDKPIALTPDGDRYVPRGPRDRMMILSPAVPLRNCARNVTQSTLATLQAEFTRAAQLCQEGIAQKEPLHKVLLGPRDLLVEHPAYLEFSLHGQTQEDLALCEGQVERRLVSLLLALEREGIYVRPIPILKRNATGTEALLRLGLPEGHTQETILVQAERFVQQVYTWPERPAEAEIRFALRTGAV